MRWFRAADAVRNEIGAFFVGDESRRRVSRLVTHAGLATLPSDHVRVSTARVDARRATRMHLAVGPVDMPVAEFEWWLTDENVLCGVLDTEGAVDAWVDACALEVSRDDVVRAYVALMDDSTRPPPTPMPSSGQVVLK